jgi:hypothetical protein
MQGRISMTTRQRENRSPFSNTGKPRSDDVAITVLTALILVVVLIVVAVL